MSNDKIKTGKSLTSFIYIVVGVITLFIMGRYLVSRHVIPTLQEFMASSTDSFGDFIGKYASSSDLTADPGTTTANTSDPTGLRDFASYKIMKIRAPGGTIQAFVANTRALRERGLSGRERLFDGQGMMFVFPEPGMYSFWMKDMKFPIDIIWIDQNKKIAGVTANLTPETYPNAFFPPSPIQFVLELNAGAVSKYKFAEGSALTF